MRRTTVLLLMALISVLTLVAPQFGRGITTWVVLLACPTVVAILAFRQRNLEDPVGRTLLTIILVLAAGQAISVALSRTSLFDPAAPIPAFLLMFGVPVIVVLCLIAIVLPPSSESEE